MVPRRGAERSPKTVRHPADDVLALWRTKEPVRITAADVVRLASRVSSTAILRERRWPAARAGDVAAAVAVAIDHLHRRVAMTPLTDVVVGNLVPHALAGDPTAALVIGHALRRLARLDPSNPDLSRLASLWDGHRTARDGTR